MNVTLRAPSSLLRVILRPRTLTTTSSAASTPSTASENLNFDDLVDNIGRTASETSNKGLSFATMLRRSKFMQLGDFEGRLVVGKVERRVADDLYIDLGLKFHAVCKAPVVNNEVYVRGARVLVRLHDPELSERFLGSARDLTLLEADATLMRLIFSPLSPPRHQTAEKSEKKVQKEEKRDKEEATVNE
ncbi:hypothetical protein PFISCL1PPCAC_23647 [Pristionchus fissidentatus]|uniref:Mrps-28 n=1 Tax=Pristionchus fissidentatus TaxID=1538716 RepID=A0AAV5WP25_9BILA|nr:hypothetical protein PFISCL1PPCAC_23647 [Pristionchus fissidentatus]